MHGCTRRHVFCTEVLTSQITVKGPMDGGPTTPPDLKNWNFLNPYRLEKAGSWPPTACQGWRIKTFLNHQWNWYSSFFFDQGLPLARTARSSIPSHCDMAWGIPQPQCVGAEGIQPRNRQRKSTTLKRDLVLEVGEYKLKWDQSHQQKRQKKKR